MRYLLQLCLLPLAISLHARTIDVGVGLAYTDPAVAVRSALPGDTVLLHAGTYRGTFWVENVAGTATSPIHVRGVHQDSVLLEGGSESFHFSDCAYLVLEDVTVTRQTGNGMNIDDGGTIESPTHHITLRRITFTKMDATGNNDLLKLSGLDDFLIEDCAFNEGAVGGSGIDMVGCHQGTIRRNTFEYMGSNAIQAKGGTQFVRIEHNRFYRAGERAVNLGGSTGLAFFRPIDAPFEAADLSVHANLFEESRAAIAFVGCVRVDVANNTIIDPTRWVVRILQETVDPTRFAPCGNNTFRNNLIVMPATLSTHVNIGPNTAPTTFTVTNNLWWMPETPARSAPTDPQFPNENAIVADPQLTSMARRVFTPKPTSPAIGAGMIIADLPAVDLDGRPWGIPPSIGALEGGLPSSIDGSTVSSHSAEDLRFLRGSIPFTTLQVVQEVAVDVFTVRGQHHGSYQLAAGEHRLHTPEPCLIVLRP